MFPKNTVATTVAMPPEKPPVSVKKDVAVLCMVEEKDLQVVIDPNHGTNRRATICACAVVLTTLILVAGTLGAITIVLTHGGRFTSEAEPHHTPQLDKNAQPELPESGPRIKIDDGGLWPPKPTTTDLVVVEDGIDDDIKFGDDDGNADKGRGGNEVEVIEDDVTTPNPEQLPDFEHSSSSRSASEPSSYDYENGRTYISSSFPFDGYYMRGGVGDPPWEEESQDYSGDASGDSQVVGGDEEEEEEGEESGSGEQSTAVTNAASSSIGGSSSITSESYHDNTFSDMYYGSSY